MRTIDDFIFVAMCLVVVCLCQITQGHMLKHVLILGTPINLCFFQLKTYNPLVGCWPRSASCKSQNIASIVLHWIFRNQNHVYFPFDIGNVCLCGSPQFSFSPLVSRTTYVCNIFRIYYKVMSREFLTSIKGAIRPSQLYKPIIAEIHSAFPVTR